MPKGKRVRRTIVNDGDDGMNEIRKVASEAAKAKGTSVHAVVSEAGKVALSRGQRKRAQGKQRRERRKALEEKIIGDRKADSVLGRRKGGLSAELTKDFAAALGDLRRKALKQMSAAATQLPARGSGSTSSSGDEDGDDTSGDEDDDDEDADVVVRMPTAQEAGGGINIDWEALGDSDSEGTADDEGDSREPKSKTTKQAAPVFRRPMAADRAAQHMEAVMQHQAFAADPFGALTAAFAGPDQQAAALFSGDWGAAQASAAAPAASAVASAQPRAARPAKEPSQASVAASKPSDGGAQRQRKKQGKRNNRGGQRRSGRR